MTELDTKYRQLVCELLGIDPIRPMPDVGFGLAFFTPEELRQLQIKVWGHSSALTMEQWQQVPIRERIALLEEVRQKRRKQRSPKRQAKEDKKRQIAQKYYDGLEEGRWANPDDYARQCWPNHHRGTVRRWIDSVDLLQK